MSEQDNETNEPTTSGNRWEPDAEGVADPTQEQAPVAAAVDEPQAALRSNRFARAKVLLVAGVAGAFFTGSALGFAVGHARGGDPATQIPGQAVFQRGGDEGGFPGPGGQFGGPPRDGSGFPQGDDQAPAEPGEDT